MVLLAEETLDRRLLSDERDHDLAVVRNLLRPDDHVVALHDPDVLHRVAADGQHELALGAAGDLRHGYVVLDVLLGEDRRAGRHVADQRQAARLDDRLHRVRRAVQQLERARLGWIAPQHADLFEVRQVRVHRRRRGQPDGLADVPHRRRIAVLGRVLADEVVDLLLALRELLADVHGLGLLRLGASERTCVRAT